MGAMPAAELDIVLEVSELKVSFRTDEGVVTAVDRMDFAVHRGRTLGIVGESGSGKSVSTKALIKLLPPNAVIDDNARMMLKKKDGQTVNLSRMKAGSKELRRLRGGEIAMIFQEPMASFSPVYTVGNQILETIHLHRDLGKAEARDAAREMLSRVGIANPELCLKQYPHELSGGMRQRAMIALALSTQPSVLIADEPTTALDVTIQAQILALIRQLQKEFNMAVIFITHDMGVIANVADEVAVVYLGRIMEFGPTAKIIRHPKHPYTQGLLMAIPSIERLDERLVPVGGDIPSPLERPAGCPFHPRCSKRMLGLCNVRTPETYHIEDNHRVSCFLYEEGPVQ